jgi:hypothetical protein
MYRVVFSLLIINKAGGLIYNRTFHPGLTQISSNDLLILAGTFHGIHAITRNLVPPSALPPPAPQSYPGLRNFPTKATGIEVLESSHFRLSCYQTGTGTKFLLLTEPAQSNVEVTLRKCHELYVDFVMKNPFYTLEMPIRCAKFDVRLDQHVGSR